MKHPSIHSLLLCVALAGVIAGTSTDIHARNGEKTFGLHGGYVGQNKSCNAGITLSYRFWEHFTLAPSASYVFRHEGLDAFTIGIDGRFPFSLSQDGKVELYPLAGISYWRWSTHTLDIPELLSPYDGFDDVTTRESRFAVDFGAGVAWNATSRLVLGIEAKYALMHHTPTWICNASIAYKF